ncbi:hypothetical protein GHT07_03125 [Caenimonas koreensis DSM 17982]|uniref:Uncharacterized protein n=1 Tax=Caenimonas koreensis DSM 17982 TaxID=1121255 RepID=A0A844B4P8_9BURK|nr:hypothetical protein [Caenimonas koreensis]MRD46256.1 hypothetical protein [Caenimonas koreensis DSM 17982]
MSDATDKLALTRLAIIEYVWRREPGNELPGSRPSGSTGRAKASNGSRNPDAAAADAHKEYADARRHGAGWAGAFRRAAGTWWRRHPARTGLDLVTPMLSSYAARRPVVYLGAAVALGGLVVVTRPWRLISVTGLVIAVLKSSQLSGMVMSAISAASYDGEYSP